jgi:hypothetical protein
MPDTETIDIPLSGINPDLQLSPDPGKLIHYPAAGRACPITARAYSSRDR